MKTRSDEPRCPEVSRRIKATFPPDVRSRVVSFPEALAILGSKKFAGKFPADWLRAWKDIRHFTPWPGAGPAEEATWAYPVFEHLEPRSASTGMKNVFVGPRASFPDAPVREATAEQLERLLMIHDLLRFFREQAPARPRLFYRALIEPTKSSADGDFLRVHVWARTGWITTDWEWKSFTLWNWYQLTRWASTCAVFDLGVTVRCSLWVDRERLAELVSAMRPTSKGRPPALTTSVIEDIVATVTAPDFDRRKFTSLANYLYVVLDLKKGTATKYAKLVEAAIAEKGLKSPF